MIYRIKRWWLRRQRRKTGERFIAHIFDMPTLSFKRNGHMYVCYCTALGWMGGSLTARKFAFESTFAAFWERLEKSSVAKP